MDTSAFDRELEARDLAGFWTARVPSHTAEKPFLWKWASVRAALMHAKDTIGIELAERRVIKPVNPHLPSKAASRTLQFNFSIVNPGETARAHRHSISAIRFVVEGEGAYTTVDGARCAMSPGDLILTPAGSWHDHTNDSAGPMIWLDGLDGPLVQALNAAFFENRPEPIQPVQREADKALRYPWSEARSRLEAIAKKDEDPFDGARLAYPSLPTLACEASRLLPGRKTRTHRHASVALYHVFAGQGRTRVGDEILEWERGDTFVIPLWQWHSHENTGGEAAVLFSMNDTPVMRSLGLYREEAQ